MYFYTADNHFGHDNRHGGIITYCKRPFKSIKEMDEVLIENHNRVVGKDDITVHAGDYSWYNSKETSKIIEACNGNHIFLKGCHDHWMKGCRHVQNPVPYIWK